jgi:hypothetical protein
MLQRRCLKSVEEQLHRRGGEYVPSLASRLHLISNGIQLNCITCKKLTRALTIHVKRTELFSSPLLASLILSLVVS